MLYHLVGHKILNRTLLFLDIEIFKKMCEKIQYLNFEYLNFHIITNTNLI